MTDLVEAPALGYSITANLGDDKQIVVQCYADSAEDLDSIHKKLDKAMAVVDRQKAKYRKIDTLKVIEDMEKNLRRLKHDLNMSEKTFKQGQEAIQLEILRLSKERSAIHIAAGEKGREHPVGADGVRANAIGVEVQRLQQQLKDNEDSRDMIINQAATNITRFEEEIAKAKAIVAECETLIEGS